MRCFHALATLLSDLSVNCITCLRSRTSRMDRGKPPGSRDRLISIIYTIRYHMQLRTQWPLNNTIIHDAAYIFQKACAPFNTIVHAFTKMGATMQTWSFHEQYWLEKNWQKFRYWTKEVMENRIQLSRIREKADENLPCKTRKSLTTLIVELTCIHLKNVLRQPRKKSASSN